MLFLVPLLLWLAATPRLYPSHDVTVELGPGEVASVEIPTAAGEFIEAVADADQALAVRTSLFDPAGKVVAIAPSLGGTGGRAAVSAYSENGGSFRLDIASQMFKNEKRSCTVRLTIRRPATAEDRISAQAHEAFARAAATKGKAAAAAFDEPLRLARLANDGLLEARATFGKGQVLATLGEFHPALPWFEKALTLCRGLGDRRAEAHALSVIALVHSNVEEYGEAIASYERALEMQRSLRQSWETALTLNNLAEAQAALGRLDLALDGLLQQVEIRRQLNDELGLNQALVALADVHLSLGDFEAALQSVRQTLPYWRRSKDREFEAAAHRKLAMAYAGAGEYQAASRTLQKPLEIGRALPDKRGLAETLNQLAEVRLLEGNSAEAQAGYRRALRAARESAFKRGEALALLGLGRIAAGRHEWSIARSDLEQALKITAGIPQPYDEGNIRRALGGVLASRNEANRADREFAQALEIQRRIADRFGQVLTLSEIARLRERRGSLDSALDALTEARWIVETTRSSLLEPSLRATFLAARRSIYERSASILVRLGREEGALDISERAHARTLLEALDTSPARERSLDAAMHSRAATGSPALPAMLASVGTHKLDGRTLARTIPDPDVVFLEYLAGESESHLWALTASAIQHHWLPGEPALQRRVNTLYRALTERNRTTAGETMENRAARMAAADRSAVAAADALSRAILPVGLSGKRVVIIPDGPLHAVPFAMLAGIAGRAFVTAPSASVLELLRERGTRSKGAEWMVIADAVYSAADPRVNRAGKLSSEVALPADFPLLRSARDAGIPAFPRLAMSRIEAQQIAQLAPAGKAIVSLDFDASPTVLRRPDIARFGVIHVAAHTLIDNARPDLSGIVFSLVDRQGRPRDGFLRAGEISKLRIEAGLVTLSACESSMGPGVRGEGLLGLSRAFLEAGAGRVLATQWKVDDRATAAFMGRFYQSLTHSKADPAAALRDAQDWMRANPEWSPPFYWAGFVLQGDWR